MNVTDSVALVTGAASGLGFATSKALVDAGAKVVLVDLPTSAGHDKAALLGDGAVFVAADVTDPDQVAVAVARAVELGSLRIVVNCAGVVNPGKIVGRKGALPLADFERVIRINLIGTFNVVRLAAEAMQSIEPVGEERGVIVNTASVAAFDGQIGQPAYAASKAGVSGLTLPAARELASSLIRVVAIAPGIFETPMMAGLSDEVRASLGQQTPHPSRLGRPAEYAALVLHIVSNAMLNGETIRLDGAIRMSPR
jgi:NAD(P)-dependent dehydrogenase (short-subunit alcohol dehydrogenase family)